MGYMINWLGETGLGLETDSGGQVGISLEEGQMIPKEFKVGDRVSLNNSPDIMHAAGVTDGNRGYYTLTHIESGATLVVWHRANEWRLQEQR